MSNNKGNNKNYNSNYNNGNKQTDDEIIKDLMSVNSIASLKIAQVEFTTTSDQMKVFATNIISDCGFGDEFDRIEFILASSKGESTGLTGFAIFNTRNCRRGQNGIWRVGGGNGNNSQNQESNRDALMSFVKTNQQKGNFEVSSEFINNLGFMLKRDDNNNIVIKSSTNNPDAAIVYIDVEGIAELMLNISQDDCYDFTMAIDKNPISGDKLRPNYKIYLSKFISSSRSGSNPRKRKRSSNINFDQILAEEKQRVQR